jgi:hypothetical protein
MRFQTFAPVRDVLARAAEFAFAIVPRIVGPFEPDFLIITGEVGCDGMLALGVLGAIQASQDQQACKLRDTNAEHLFG